MTIACFALLSLLTVYFTGHADASYIYRSRPLPSDEILRFLSLERDPPADDIGHTSPRFVYRKRSPYSASGLSRFTSLVYEPGSARSYYPLPYQWSRRIGSDFINDDAEKGKRFFDSLGGYEVHSFKKRDIDEGLFGDQDQELYDDKRSLDSLGGFNVHGWKRSIRSPANTRQRYRRDVSCNQGDCDRASSTETTDSSQDADSSKDTDSSQDLEDSLDGFNIRGWKINASQADNVQGSLEKSDLSIIEDKKALDSLGGFNVHGYKRALDSLGGFNVHGYKRALDSIGGFNVHEYKRAVDSLGGFNVHGYKRDDDKKALDSLGGFNVHGYKRALDSLGGFNVHGYKREAETTLVDSTKYSISHNIHSLQQNDGSDPELAGSSPNLSGSHSSSSDRNLTTKRPTQDKNTHISNVSNNQP